MNDAIKGRPPAGRRDFLKKLLAGIISGVLGLVPFAAGVTVFLDPLRRRSVASTAVRVTTLQALPDDGLPRKFPVVATRVDAWNKFNRVPLGAVWLRRTGDLEVQAFNVVCPHAGCAVEFNSSRGNYHCPCHNSSFSVAGKIDDPSSPAPRGLDSLEVEIRNQKEIWVRFQNFQSGPAQKIPMA